MADHLPVPCIGRFSIVLFPSQAGIAWETAVKEVFRALSSQGYADHGLAELREDKGLFSIKAINKDGFAMEIVGSTPDTFKAKPQIEIIWYAPEDLPNWSHAYPPTLGAYAPDFFHHYIDILAKWPENLEWRLERAAITISLVYPVESPSDGAALLNGMLSNVKTIIGGVDDFLYQANFPAKIQFRDQELDIIRLGRWGGRTFFSSQHIAHGKIGNNITLDNVTLKSAPATTVLVYFQLGSHFNDRLDLSVGDSIEFIRQLIPQIDEIVEKGDSLS